MSNFVGIVAGPRGAGKTTLCKKIVKEKQAKGRAVLIQDQLRQFQSTADWYQGASQYHHDQSYAQHSGAPQSTVAAIGCSAEELLAYAVDLAEARKKRGLGPVLVVFDEATHVEVVTATHVPPHVQELLSTCRHRGVEFLINCQHLGQLQVSWKDQATHLFFFRTSNEDRLRKASTTFGINKAEIFSANEALPKRFHFLLLQDERFVKVKEGLSLG